MGHSENTTVSLAEAKARLSELTELAAAGERVVITKRGKPVVQLSSPMTPRKPINPAVLRQLTAGLPAQQETAGNVMRQMRDKARY